MTVIYASIAVVLLLWAGAIVFMYKTQHRQFFPGDGAPFDADYPQLTRLGGVRKSAEREGQALRWHEVPPKGDEKGTLLVFHGNRGGAAERFEYARQLSPLGWRVALAEFPGYAGDKGGAGEWRMLRNALAAFDELQASAKGLPLVLLGESMGTGPATFIAMKREPKALVLHTPYPSMADVALARYPWLLWKKLVKEPVRAELWAPHVKCPVMVLHGSEDLGVHYRLGQRQAKNFSAPLQFVTIEGAAHGNLRDFDAPRYWGAVRDFLGAQA